MRYIKSFFQIFEKTENLGTFLWFEISNWGFSDLNPRYNIYKINQTQINIAGVTVRRRKYRG